MQTHVGVATADITPDRPNPLCGFAARAGGSWAEIRARLSLQAFAFGAGPAPHAILVCADLLWWGPDIADPLRRELAERYDLPLDAVMLHASHTHSAPGPSVDLSPLIGVGDRAYLATLVRLTGEAVAAAVADLAPVRLARGTGHSRIGMNRRRLNPGGRIGGADPDGPIDPEVGVVRINRADGSTKAVLVHYSCHPVINADAAVTPDYPGVLRERIQAAIGPRCTVAFLQGCCGDINPDVRDERGEFRRAGRAETERIGGALAAAALEALSRSVTELADARIGGRTHEVALPMDTPTPEELRRRSAEPGIWGEWATKLLTEPERLVESWPLRLSRLDLAAGWSLLGLNAEVSLAYGRYIKEHTAGTTLPLPYTNGMIGYVVTAEQLRQGGYEPDESYPYIYRPGRFTAEIEELVRAGIDEVCT